MNESQHNDSIFVTGQRWLSEMEPELGLGVVKDTSQRRVRVLFPAGECEREYAMQTAPLKRVRFQVGHTIRSRVGQELVVEDIEESSGLLIYKNATAMIPEDQLEDTLSFTTPLERFNTGLVDSNHAFRLRMRALDIAQRIRQSPARGFIGGRIDLIPHQLYVAGQVSNRPAPRVLLSDEVGLGKTIEACLIIHRLLLTGRISRVLIAVPESLVHQWFVELLRRFNLVFKIVDQERVDEAGTDNPFTDENLILCSIDFMSAAKVQGKITEADWDLLVIDEAHHLTEDSPEYALAMLLSNNARDVLLVTATPEQLGHKSHFARLRLLDPDRFYDFEEFERQESYYFQIAAVINTLLDDRPLDSNQHDLLSTLFPANQRPDTWTDADKKRIISELLDRHGTGRAIYRNTRASMPGFPERQVHLIPLSSEDQHAAQSEFESDIEPIQSHLQPDYRTDPRIEWLADYLRQHNHKVLLICRSIEKVTAIEQALRHKIEIKTTLFHEKLTLLQRDRNAAWFSQDDGAQLMLCSEIGSEGRNFQFAHHLVLFDLPTDPELLEQRIGRLDRIGQKQTIHIHVPYLIKTPYEVMARWYHDGLDALRHNVPCAFQIYNQLGDAVKQAALSNDDKLVEQVIHQTKIECQRLSTMMQQGRDRLLELHSFQPDEAAQLTDAIRKQDTDHTVERFMLDLFEEFAIEPDLLQDRTYKLHLDHLTNLHFPLPPLRGDDLVVTFDRQVALKREDIEFITQDHPTMLGSVDLLLGSESGNCAMALWSAKDGDALLLQTVFVLECLAPQQLHADRFLAPTSIHCVVNHELVDKTDEYQSRKVHAELREGTGHAVFRHPQIKERLPDMLASAETYAAETARQYISKARERLASTLQPEIERLNYLQKKNRHIKQQDINTLAAEFQTLDNAIEKARVRLDAIRVIYKGTINT